MPHQDPNELSDPRRQMSWFESDILDKDPPLSLLLFVRRKGGRKRIGQFGRNRRSAPREGCGDRAGEPVVVERERPAENPDIVEENGRASCREGVCQYV